MIFDRTKNDVLVSIDLIKNKIQKFQSLTDAEISILEKGTITINTLNRIEDKQNELKVLFNNIGYYNCQIKNKSWSFDKIFNIDDLKRIISNAEVLKNAFFTYITTPKTPSALYHYQNINDIEKILYDLDFMIAEVKSHYKECGNFECGGNE